MIMLMSSGARHTVQLPSTIFQKIKAWTSYNNFSIAEFVTDSLDSAFKRHIFITKYASHLNNTLLFNIEKPIKQN